MASGKFTWRIDNFSGQSERIIIYSDVFTAGECNWRLNLYPKGNNVVDYLSMYLEVANKESLPSGWSIDAKFNLTVVNQLPDHASINKETQRKFTARGEWGWKSFKSLAELHDSSKGHIVNDTLVVEVEIVVLNVSPPTLVLDIFLSNTDKFITYVDQGQTSTDQSSAKGGMKSQVPSLEEVEMAKQSLEDCLSDIFKLNITDRLAKSLETLSRAETGLSSEEQQSVQLFWGEFDDFVADFLTFEQENSEFELHKLANDQMFDSIKKMQETHGSNKQRLANLMKEEKELKKKTEEVKSSKDRLISEWQTLIKELEAKKSEHKAQEKKLGEIEERKRIAEERMSRSTAAWSSLKLHFAKG